VEGGAHVDLVFTDVVMPGPLRTRDFAQALKALRPELPVLFTSGYTDNAIIHQGRLDEGVHLISKPYARAELARRLAQLLPADAPAA
jgi:CheY-like chemotaxis protein